MLLKNKVAFVTGASSGIGRGTALRFGQEGAAVVAVARHTDEENTCKVCAEIDKAGGKSIFVPADVAKPDDVKRAVDETIKKFGRLDIVVANAGINGVWAPIDELEPDEWNKTIATNLTGTFLTLHYTVPHLKKAGGGSVIIVSSVNGNRTFVTPGATAYSTTKAGQVAMMKMLAVELGKDQIRVNAVCPGAIHTNIEESTERKGTEKLGLKIEYPQGKPAVNEGQGEVPDVADVCLFLASDMSRHVSGIELYVDGGFSLAR
ncbi:MAG: SDR family oxidoreductase [Phycisphaerae bacterium]